MNKPQQRNYQVGDEISYALASSVRYGTVVRVMGEMAEIQFEDGQKEMKKFRDSRLRLLRRQSAQDDKPRQYDADTREVLRSDIRRRWR
jgi:hypothetical protein